jgi:hypothetical protein
VAIASRNFYKWNYPENLHICGKTKTLFRSVYTGPTGLVGPGLALNRQFRLHAPGTFVSFNIPC